MLSNPKPLYLIAGLVGSLAIIPGLPALPLLVLSGSIFFIARKAQVKCEEQALMPAAAATPDGKPKKKSDEDTPVEELLQVETFELTVGYGLVSLVDSTK